MGSKKQRKKAQKMGSLLCLGDKYTSIDVYKEDADHYVVQWDNDFSDPVSARMPEKRQPYPGEMLDRDHGSLYRHAYTGPVSELIEIVEKITGKRVELK